MLDFAMGLVCAMSLMLAICAKGVSDDYYKESSLMPPSALCNLYLRKARYAGTMSVVFLLIALTSVVVAFSW